MDKPRIREEKTLRKCAKYESDMNEMTGMIEKKAIESLSAKYFQQK